MMFFPRFCCYRLLTFGFTDLAALSGLIGGELNLTIQKIQFIT